MINELMIAMCGFECVQENSNRVSIGPQWEWDLCTHHCYPIYELPVICLNQSSCIHICN